VVPIGNLRPLASVDVETEDACRLLSYVLGRRAAVDRSVNAAAGVLGETDAGTRPLAVGEKSQVEVSLSLAAFGRRLMPRVDEAGAFLEGVAAERLDLEVVPLRRA
jgi:hypothetical protein